MFDNNAPIAVLQAIRDNNIWWKHAQSTSMACFFSEYNLHDSYWLRSEYQSNGSFQVLLHWDNFGIPASKQLNLSINPYLCISFGIIYQLISTENLNTVSNVIIEADTKTISDAQRMIWFELMLKQTDLHQVLATSLLDEELQCTWFKGAENGYTHIFHPKLISILCINHEGSAIKIPDI